MSWDFDMYTTAGSDARIYTDLDKNYTSNVSPMFYDALDHEEGIRGITGGSF